MTGHIVNIIENKGYFFIKSDEDGVEYFAHKSELNGCRWEDVRYRGRATFTAEPHDRGPRAVDIRLTA